jgi:hypothetical protein
MGWKDPEFRERWGLIVSTIQALATLGAFLAPAPDSALSTRFGEVPQPDLLAVRAVRGSGTPEVVTVPVNEHALRLGHFIQREINRGAFAALDPDAQERVERAVESYVQAHLLPRTPPPHVRPGMTLDEIADEIAHHQDDRFRAARQIEGLREIIEAAGRG